MQRFEAGHSADQLRKLAKNYREEARVLWPDDEERRGDAIEAVDDDLEAALGAMEDRR